MSQELIPELATPGTTSFFPSRVNMAVDLKTKSAELLKAWQDIFDDKCETDW